MRPCDVSCGTPAQRGQSCLPGRRFMTVDSLGSSAFRQIRDFRNSNAFSSKSFLGQSGRFGVACPYPFQCQ